MLSGIAFSSISQRKKCFPCFSSHLLEGDRLQKASPTLFCNKWVALGGVWCFPGQKAFQRDFF